MIEMNEQELDRATREVIKRAVVDAAFRATAVADGNKAIASVSGKGIPAGVTFKFVENYGKTTKTIVLPDPVAESETLSEKDLEAVAGGSLDGGDSECGVTCGQGSCLHSLA